MKAFPAVCVDNFYKDPDKIREFALGLDYYSPDPAIYPGKRTKLLDEIEPDFFKDYCDKFLSLYYDFRYHKASWKIATAFQLIQPDDIVDPLKNLGWIHQDDNCLFASIIYLNPEPDPTTGTSLYKLKNKLHYNIATDTIRKTSQAKLHFYKDKVDKNYDESITKLYSLFDETVRYDNIYNRFISFDGTQYHSANNLYKGSEARLTQVTFVYEMETDGNWPIKRMQEINDL
jgi:hypothetical protein